MSKISDFLARKASMGEKSQFPQSLQNIPIVLNSEPVAPPPSQAIIELPPEPEPVAITVPEVSTEAAARLGAENEALRNLVVEAARKVEDLDNLKVAFNRIIDPLQRTLVSLEQERS